MRFRNGRFEYHWLLSVEGEAGDGGNGGGTGSDQQGSGEETGDVSQIPAGLPEKFWDASTNTVRQDDLIGAYNNISSSYTKKQEDIRAEIDGERMANRPADVDGYKFAMPESVQIPDGYEFTLDDTDPILQFWREHSFDFNISQGLVHVQGQMEVAQLPILFCRAHDHITLICFELASSRILALSLDW